MILFRCFARRQDADAQGEGGPLWFPRPRQGQGRHDNPAEYACLYLTEHEISSAVEQLTRFRGEPSLESWMLRRRGLPLALATVQLDDAVELVDLDHPPVLTRERLRPSLVATHERKVTQPQALRLWRRHREAAGLRWWSTFEALWANVTLFDRAAPSLRLLDVRELTLEHPVVVEAAEFLGLAA